MGFNGIWNDPMGFYGIINAMMMNHEIFEQKRRLTMNFCEFLNVWPSESLPFLEDGNPPPPIQGLCSLGG